MEKANNDIRLMARGAGVPLWKICLVLEISEPTLTRKLRIELPETEKVRLLTIIEKLREEQ